MSYFSAFAVYFIFWWVTLFAILPFGLKTQEEDADVTLGTTESAPANFSFWRKAAWTTLVSAVLFAIYYWVTSVLGLSLESIPRIVPDYE